ncbi:hypothetical protein PR048_033006 [Dryococelus australis]|uniref:RNA-directed DNA polymerase n=1 Tax=Dryococelus australis TaxID=614101 RepID=A0ABQ9G3U6_9NEOP|nr:hypothetical protein PR048_033006 [Dryococelus australis]
MQEKDRQRELVGYASHTLSDRENRHSQIEKDALALKWCADRFRQYILGLETKHIYDPTPRLRLVRNTYSVQYNPGKQLEFEQEVKAFVGQIVSSYLITDKILSCIQAEQYNDPIYKILSTVYLAGQAERRFLSIFFHICNTKMTFIIIHFCLKVPAALQLHCLKCIHAGNLGIVKCRQRAKMSVWWFGLSSQLENLVRNCPNCIQERQNPKQPFLQAEKPSRPCQVAAVHLFKCDTWYLILNDYYFRFFEIYPLTSMSDVTVIGKLKVVFARFGIPEIVRADSGSQFISRNFQSFAQTYNFQGVTSSPHYPQCNGCIVGGVKVAKMEDVVEPRLAQHREHLQKEKQVANYNKRHRVRHLPGIQVHNQAPIGYTPTGVSTDELDGFWFLHFLLVKIFGLKEVV